MAQKSKKKNTSKVIFFTLYFLVCIAFIGAYFAIEAFAPEKLVVDQKNIELQVLADGTTKSPVLEINYYKNATDEGLELFEVRWNTFNNENKEKFKSFGFQFVASNELGSIEWEEYVNDDYGVDYLEYKEASALFHKSYYARTQTSYRLSDGESYMYASTDDFYTTTNNDEISLKEQLLRVQIGEEIYILQPIGRDYDGNYITNGGNYYDYDISFLVDKFFYSYYAKDYNYINHLLYEKFKDSKAGTSYYEFSFGDLFKFYKYDESSESYKGDEITGTALDKLIELSETNMVIKYNIYEDGAKTYTDSLFKSIKGNTSFNLTGDYVSEDYYYGRPVIKLNQTHFDLVQVYGNSYALKLKKSTISYLNSHEEDFVVEVEIDLSFFDDLGYSFFGMADNSGLENYSVYRVYTISAEGVETEVEHA